VAGGVVVEGAVDEGALDPAGAAVSSFLLQAVRATASTEAIISVLLIIRYLLCDGIYAARGICPRGLLAGMTDSGYRSYPYESV
jgi:hypothetical protein